MPGSREISDQKNLQEASEIRKSGFKTKIHASPHKEEVDRWIIEKRWSSRMVVNELKRLYPKEDHPSDRAIDNYRKRYLPKEFAKSAGLAHPEYLRDQLTRQFDAPKEGVNMWKRITKALDGMDEMMSKTNMSVVPKSYIDLLKIAESWYTSICEQFKDVGLMERSQQSSVTYTEETQIKKGDVTATKKKVTELKSEIKKLKEARKELDELDEIQREEEENLSGKRNRRAETIPTNGSTSEGGVQENAGGNTGGEAEETDSHKGG